MTLIDPSEELSAFDQLPKSLQKAMRESPVYIEAKDLLPHYRRNGAKKTATMLQGWISEWQKKHPMVEGPKR